MKENSNKIGNKIKEIRKKYGEKDEVLKEMNYIETKTKGRKNKLKKKQKKS